MDNQKPPIEFGFKIIKMDREAAERYMCSYIEGQTECCRVVLVELWLSWLELSKQHRKSLIIPQGVSTTSTCLSAALPTNTPLPASVHSTANISTPQISLSANGYTHYIAKEL